MDIKTKALFDAKVAIINNEFKKAIEKVKDKYSTLDERDLLIGSEFENKYDKEIQQIKKDTKLKIAVLRAEFERESTYKSSQHNKFYEYNPDRRVFEILGRDGKFHPLVLRVKRGEKFQSTLFELLLRNWEKYGKEPINKFKLIKDLSGLVKDEIESDRFKTIFRHLRDKIKDARLDTFIQIDYERNKQGGYTGNINFCLVDITK